MKEFKSVLFAADKGLGAPKGTVDTIELDKLLNGMSCDGWDLAFLENLNSTHGSGSLLCLFSRELTA